MDGRPLDRVVRPGGRLAPLASRAPVRSSSAEGPPLLLTGPRAVSRRVRFGLADCSRLASAPAAYWQDEQVEMQLARKLKRPDRSEKVRAPAGPVVVHTSIPRSHMRARPALARAALPGVHLRHNSPRVRRMTYSSCIAPYAAALTACHGKLLAAPNVACWANRLAPLVAGTLPLAPPVSSASFSATIRSCRPMRPRSHPVRHGRRAPAHISSNAHPLTFRAPLRMKWRRWWRRTTRFVCRCSTRSPRPCRTAAGSSPRVAQASG
jgi:hypothetical protein